MFLNCQNMTLFLQCDSRDGVSLFDHTSGVSTAPAATADSTVRSQWTTRDAVARLAVRSHLPSAERAHFGQYKTVKSLYDADLARYSSPDTAALSRLMLPYLFRDLAAFATVADLIAHLATALPFPLIRDHFLSLCPTELFVDLLEERLAAAEKSILAVGASRGNHRTPFFEGCSPVPLLPSVASTAAVDLVGTEEVGTASAPRGRRRNSKGKGNKGGGAVEAVEEAVEEAEEVAVEVGVVPGVGASVEAVEVVEAAAEVVEAAEAVVEAAAAVVKVAAAVVLVEVQPRSLEALVVASASSSRGPVRPRRPSSFVSGTLGVGGLGNVAVFDLDFDAILAAMYALSDCAEGDCYLSVPPDPGIEAAALGASASAAPGTGESAAPGAGESALSGTAPTEDLHTFTLDSGASRSFFRDSTTLTPLSRPVVVSLADPSGGPVLAHSSTVLPCPAAPSGLLSGLHLPSFSTNLVSGADLQDALVDQFAPGGQCVTHCTCSRIGRHLATFIRRPGSSLYTLTTASPPVSASGHVAASSQVFAAASRSSPASAPCSCRPLSHETLLWHHRLGHPSLPRLRGMVSRTLVSGLPRSLPPLPLGPTPTCVPCVEGRQRAASHSSTFPPTEAPLQTLHMDVWGPACVRGQGHKRYFLLVVDDYSRYTTFFPLRSKGEIEVHNGIAERRIGMVMDVARTSMIHAAAPHFLWPFAVQYDAHQINLQPHVSLPETTPTLRWTGKVGNASAFRFYHPTSRHVLSSQDVTFDESVSYYHPAVPVEVAVDSGTARGAELAGAGTRGAEPGGAEPEHVGSGGAEPAGARTRGVESGGAEPERVEPWGAEPGGTLSWGAEPARAKSGGSPGVTLRRETLSPQRLREWYTRHCRRATGAAGAGAAGGAAGAGAAGGAAGAGAAGAAGPGGARTGGTGAARAGGAAGVGAAGTGAGGAAGVVTGDLEDTGAVFAVPGGTARPRPYNVPLLQQVLILQPSPSPPPPLLSTPPVQSQSLLQLASPLPCPSPSSGRTRGLTERRELESCPVSPDSRPVSPESRPASSESRSALHVRTVCPGRRASRPRPPPVPGTHSMTLRPSTAPQRVPHPSPPASSLPDSPDPESDSLRAATPTVSRFLATAVTDPLFESTAASALVARLVDFAAACRLDFATSLVAESASESVCPPSVGGECALGTDGDPDAPDIPTPRSYAEAIEGPYSSQWQAAMDAEMASWKSTGTYVDEVPPPGANIVSGMWIFRVKRPPGSPPVFKARYIARGFSQRQGVDSFQTFSPTPKMTTLRVLLHVAAQRDYELHSLDFSTSFLQGSLHEEIWLRRSPGFTGLFPAGTQWILRRPVYGLRQAPREWHDTLRTSLATLGFAPSTADPSLFLRTDTTLPPFYVLMYVEDLVFATADTEALAHVKSELAQHTITLTQSHMVQQVLQRFGFTYSSPQFTPLPTGHSLSAPPSDESVEPSGPYPELVGCLMYMMTCTRPDLAYPLSLLARYVAPGRHRKVHWDAAKRVLRYLCSTSGMGLVLGGRARVVLTGHANASSVDDLDTQRSSLGYTFSLGSDSVSWQSTRSSFVLSSSCEAEIYAGAMASQELHWLTYLLTDLGEAPRSPPVLYVDNKAMLALCQEHRLEHRTKHIALRYFLARELQQRGQLRLAYVASQANTVDVFTKALQPFDHQRFCTILGLDYELHSLDFSTAFLQGSLHEENWLRRPHGFTGLFPAGTQWSVQRPVYGLRQAPREWHVRLRTTLAALGFAFSTADPSLFLRTGTSLPPFYILVYVDVLVFATADTEALTLVLQSFGFRYSSPLSTPLPTGHSLSAPPSDESVEPSGPYPELVGCLMYLMTCTRPDLAYPLSLLACYVAPGRLRKELRWLTYLLTDLGEAPRSPPVLYVDNKAMLALCQEHRLEHRTKHIALRYFLARELQQRG
ncbi:unnamed protein product [Closterium sp. NIES-53]